jgi:hypothetical protein
MVLPGLCRRGSRGIRASSTELNPASANRYLAVAEAQGPLAETAHVDRAEEEPAAHPGELVHVLEDRRGIEVIEDPEAEDHVELAVRHHWR